MGLVEMLELIAAYYKKSTTGKMSYQRRELCTKMLQKGLQVKDIMDAIDKATLRYGLLGLEREYWATIRGECLNTYRRLIAEGVLEEEKKAAP